MKDSKVKEGLSVNERIDKDSDKIEKHANRLRKIHEIIDELPFSAGTHVSNDDIKAALAIVEDKHIKMGSIPVKDISSLIADASDKIDDMFSKLNHKTDKPELSLDDRFALFKSVFEDSTLDFKKWKKIEHWDDVSNTARTINMAMFPDGIKSLRWGYSPARNIIFVPSQDKLASVSLIKTSIGEINIPDDVTSIKSLILVKTNIFSLNLGGCTESITELLLSDKCPNPNILPDRMISLQRLSIGCDVGKIYLPKDSTNLTNLKMYVDIDSDKVVIPKTYTNLAHVSISGQFGGVSNINSEGGNGLKSLHLCSDSHVMAIPKLAGLKELDIVTSTKLPLRIPTSLSEGLERLCIRAHSAPKVTVSGDMGSLENLEIYAMNSESNITISEGCASLVEISMRIGGNIIICPNLSNLSRLTCTAPKLTVHQGETLSKLGHLSLSCDNVTKFNLPDELPNLKYSYIKDKQISLDNVIYPRSQAVTAFSF